MYDRPRDDDDTAANDARLLTLAAAGSREALAELARRYVGFVYHAAVRQVRDPHLAEDVTQAVFMILSKKVGRLRPDTLMHAWLFMTTRYAAKNAMKMRARRTHHESVAAAQRGEASPAPVEITPLLDEALAELGETDRSAVLLSYFGQKSWHEVGRAIGASEDAARKRVGRAVVQMRRVFVRQGMHVSTAAVGATLVSAAQSAAAPASLVKNLTAGLLSAPAASSGAGGIATGVTHMMACAMIKVAAAFATAVLATLGAAGAMVLHQAMDAKANNAPAAAAATAPGRGATLKSGVTVEVLGVTESGGKQTWNPDGSPAAPDDIPVARPPAPDVPLPAYVLVARISGTDPAGTDVRFEVQPSGMTITQYQNEGNTQYGFVTMHPKEGQRAVTLRIRLAAGEWETTASREGGEGMVVSGEVSFGGVHDLGEGRCATSIADGMIDHQAEIVVIDTNGQEHKPDSIASSMGKGFRQTDVQFPLAVGEIDRIEFRTRPFDQWVEFKNVSLAPDQNAGFAVTSSGR